MCKPTFRLVLLLTAGLLGCVLFSACSGGGDGEQQKKYALSVNDFMRGRKLLLFSTSACAFIICPEDFQVNEIASDHVICDAKVYVLRDAESTNPMAVFGIDKLSYRTDENGNAYMRFAGFKDFSASNAWTFLAGALAGTGGTLGGGEDSNNPTVSDVNMIMNFTGGDKGLWEDRCWVSMDGDSGWETGSGALLLRPKEFLFGK